MRKLLKSTGGFTLIELLATVTVSSIILAVLYSIFATGITLYQKIQVEAQMRDDADYIATMILNEMYENPPRSVKVYEDTAKSREGIQLIRAEEKVVNKYLVEDSEQDEKTIQIFFEEGNLFIERSLIGQQEPYESIEIESPSATIDLEESFITLGQETGKCSSDRKECATGTIELQLLILPDEGMAGSLIEREPLKLNSSFGF